MNTDDLVQERLTQIKQMSQKGAETLQELLHRQHYAFAHKILPYVVENQFDELVSCIADGSIQEWILQGWKDVGEDQLAVYSVVVQPLCQFVKPAEEIGVLYFLMPSPRTTGEAVYTAIVFLIDESAPESWLRRYFTLELGAFFSLTASSMLLDAESQRSVHWTFAGWSHSKHSNYGSFSEIPTLENFLKSAVNKAASDWSL